MSARPPAEWPRPWTPEFVSGLSAARHVEWRERSCALRRARRRELGRDLTGAELVEMCDRPAAEAMGFSDPEREG